MCNKRPHRPLTRLWFAFLLLFPLVFFFNLTLAQSVSKSLEDYFRLAKEIEIREDYAGAEKIYQEAAANYPRQPEVFKRLGLIYQTELKFQESIDSFQKVLQQAPQYPEGNFYLGLSYLGLNQFEKAIEAFDKELEANPKYRRAHYYEALAYQSLNRNADAVRQYDLLLKEDPTDKKVLYQLIKLLKSVTVATIKQLDDLDPDSDFMLVLKAEGCRRGKIPRSDPKIQRTPGKESKFSRDPFHSGRGLLQ